MPVGANNPIDNPQAWHQVQVAGVWSPGHCEVKEHKRAHEWDIKKGKGAKGANITFVQRPPAKFTVTFYAGYYDASGAGGATHFLAWDAFIPLLKYDPTKKTPQAIDIYHPALADIEIATVVTESIGGWEHMGDSYYKREVEFLEYFPPPAKSASGSPTGAISGPPPGISGNQANVPPNAQDESGQKVQDIINQLSAQP